jgi:hypothetical protein
MLVASIVAPGDHFARMRLVLLHRRIRKQADVVVYVKVEQRP